MSESTPVNPVTSQSSGDTCRVALLSAISNGVGWNAREILAFVGGMASTTGDPLLALAIQDFLKNSR